jgi:hypothetical protein
VSLTWILQNPASAQEAACLKRTLPLGVEDSEGVPIRDIRISDLENSFRAGAVKLVSVVADERPHRIVILVDASGTMATKWREVLAPASDLAETELPNTKMALLVFKEKIEEQVSFTQGQSVVAEKLRQRRLVADKPGRSTGGKTALFDTLLVGLQLLETPSSADSLYLISDGADTASHAHLDEVARRLSSNGVRLFVSLTVGHFGNRTPNPEEERGPFDMNDLVKKTGGELNIPFARGVPRKPEEAERISQAMHRFYQTMAWNYRLDVELPASLEKPTNWELKLSEEGRGRWKNARLYYPSELMPCKH